MTVTVHLFAAARELVGNETAVELPPSATVADLRTALVAQHPSLVLLLARSAVAVNHEYADDARPIHLTDELAVIPPVSGG